MKFALAVLEGSVKLPTQEEMEKEVQREMHQKQDTGVQVKHLLNLDKYQWDITWIWPGWADSHLLSQCLRVSMKRCADRGRKTHTNTDKSTIGSLMPHSGSFRKLHQNRQIEFSYRGQIYNIYTVLLSFYRKRKSVEILKEQLKKNIYIYVCVCVCVSIGGRYVKIWNLYLF